MPDLDAGYRTAVGVKVGFDEDIRLGFVRPSLGAALATLMM
jgi:hypothetical protein